MSEDKTANLKPGADEVKTGIDNGKNPNCNKIITDRFGNDWFCMRNPLKISGNRGLSAEKAKRFMGMKLDEKSLKELISKQIALFNEQQYAESMAVAYEIKHRLDFISEEKSVLDLVFVYYFMRDEDPEVPNEYFRDKKHAILDQDPVTRAFFLRIGISLMKKSSGIPDEDLIQYLEQIKTEADRIYRYISRPNPKDLIKK